MPLATGPQSTPNILQTREERCLYRVLLSLSKEDGAQTLPRYEYIANTIEGIPEFFGISRDRIKAIFRLASMQQGSAPAAAA